jgi:DNA-binding PadR family transcriptional regulator
MSGVHDRLPARGHRLLDACETEYIRFRMKKPSSAEIARFIPLRPSAFAVLAALAHEPRPGIEILDHIHATLPGSTMFGGGTLYRLLRDMRAEGLIQRAGPEHADKRHVRHSLTPLGRAVMTEEAARLEHTLRFLRATPARGKR